MLKYEGVIIFALLLLFFVPSIWAAASFDGDWVGGFERPESRVFVHTHFGAANDGTTGTIDVIDLAINTRPMGKPPVIDPRFGYPINTQLMGKPLDKLELNPSRVHFELADKASQLSFEGQVTNGVMTGLVEDRGKKFPFRLDFVIKIDPSRYTGIYHVGSGHFIRIGPDIVSLFSFDTQSGQLRFLLPRTEADFVCGPGAKAYPVQATIHFTTNQLGRVTAMQWKEETAPALVGTPIKELQEEEVSFKNGETTLSGTLVLPPTKGPHPAVVLVHGAGPGIRSNFRFLADFFALNGVAALMYDKRGCGTSTGDWRKSGFDDFAGDALAGLELLKNRPDINPHQIGLWGVSQGGWIVGLAASRSTNVAFIISVSGPGITPEAQGVVAVEHWMKAAGFSETDLREARSLYLLNSRCTRTDSGWDEFEAVRKAAQNKPWYNANPYLGCCASGAEKQWQLIWDYDPVPALRKVYCPVLSIFGELDSLVPAQKSADIWKTALTEAGNQDVVIKIVPHADHGIADTRNWITLPDFFTLQRDWLLKHVTVNY
ncbi:MAG: alpha/beta fold hydrolase [Verrucomicrobiota bacterium]|jgi:pimeloyl-ACP methyl ester carboxylesterase